jgi:hypothetical protein
VPTVSRLKHGFECAPRYGREHIEYVPTQIVREYIRHISRTTGRRRGMGVVYQSSRNCGGKRCVLFIRNKQCCDARRGWQEAETDGTFKKRKRYWRLGITERVRDAGLPREAPMDVFLSPSMVDPPIAHPPYPSVAQAKAEIASHNDGRHLSVTVGPTRSHSVAGTDARTGAADAGILAMEGDQARLIATDRSRPFRFENVGPQASLDDAGALF